MRHVRLSSLVSDETLGAIAHDIGLAEALALAPDLIAGKVRGRVVVDVNR